MRRERWLRSVLFLWPLSWTDILSSKKDFSRSPVLGSPSLNRLGLHTWRQALADRCCNSRRRKIRSSLPAELCDEWDRTGLICIGNFLSDDELTAVCSELEGADFSMIMMHQPPSLTRRANLDNETCAERFPVLHRLLNRQLLIGLLQYAAGYRGRPLIAVQCIHSDAPSKASRDPQTDWHVDTFHSTAKAWLFLHDVEAGSGPVEYMLGSHRREFGRKSWERSKSIGAHADGNVLHSRGSMRATVQELETMGYSSRSPAEYSRNTLVVADTSGFHRRSPSHSSTVRVEIYLSLRRNPFFAGFFPSTLELPVIKNRWAMLTYKMYAWLYSKGVPSWIPCDTAGLSEEEKRRISFSRSSSIGPEPANAQNQFSEKMGFLEKARATT